MTKTEKQIAEALIEECRKRAFVWNPNEGVEGDDGMGLGVDGSVDFEQLAKAAINVIKNVRIDA